MKYVEEYRDPQACRRLVSEIHQRATSRWTISIPSGSFRLTVIDALSVFWVQNASPSSWGFSSGTAPRWIAATESSSPTIHS